MSGKTLGRRLGRPPTKFIENPRFLRIKGEVAYRETLERREGKLAEPSSRRRYELKLPKGGRTEMERGLRYAAWAEVIPYQSVRHILMRAAQFLAWLPAQKPASGPAPDAVEAERLFVVVDMVARIRRKRKLDDRKVVESEVGQAWELVYGYRLERELLRKRLNRFKPRLAAFQAYEKTLKRVCKSLD